MVLIHPVVLCRSQCWYSKTHFIVDVEVSSTSGFYRGVSALRLLVSARAIHICDGIQFHRAQKYNAHTAVLCRPGRWLSSGELSHEVRPWLFRQTRGWLK
jgi:hypothetical protein